MKTRNKIQTVLSVLSLIAFLNACNAPEANTFQTAFVDESGDGGEEIPADEGGEEEPPVEEPIACDPNALPFGAGSGTSEDPYQICDRDQLASLGSVEFGERIVLVEDLNLVGFEFVTIPDFAGILDGQNHTISNMVGSFFGDISGGTVQNLVIQDGQSGTGPMIAENTFGASALIKNVTVYANATDGAGIVYKNRGTIENCHFEGLVYKRTTNTHTGAIAYENVPTGVVRYNSKANYSTNGSQVAATQGQLVVNNGTFGL